MYCYIRSGEEKNTINTKNVVCLYTCTYILVYHHSYSIIPIYVLNSYCLSYFAKV